MRKNREFETSKGLTSVFFMNIHHKMFLNGLLRPGGNHKYGIGVCEWFLKVFHSRSMFCLRRFFADIQYQRAFKKMTFRLHFVQAGTHEVEHL